MSNSIIAVLWGSETGTAQYLAEKTELKLNANGLQSQAIDMSDMKMESLPNSSSILLITSTWGDGDPPSNAMDLLGELQAKKVDLTAQGYSVCALGDTAYYQFCKCGKDFDEAFQSQGAKRLYPMQECEIDYDAPYEQWLQAVLNILQSKESTTA
jgi:sulfite reductase (NADPH) flavoprotein alpha-component